MARHPDSKELTFLYPFDGRPKALPLVGLFTLSPEVYMKLTDLSPQAAFKAQGLEPLFRRLKRLGDKGAPEEAVLKVLQELLPHLGDNPLVLEMKSALNGDKEAFRRVEDSTRFEFMFAGLGVERQDYSFHHWFMLLSERVGVAAALDLKKGDGASAGRRIAEHPILGNLLWPEARERFERGTSEQQLAPLLVSLTMECTLASIAAWDRHLGRREGTDRSFFGPIIPSIKQPGRNPSSLFYDELQRRLGAKSIGRCFHPGREASLRSSNGRSTGGVPVRASQTLNPSRTSCRPMGRIVRGRSSSRNSGVAGMCTYWDTLGSTYQKWPGVCHPVRARQFGHGQITRSAIQALRRGQPTVIRSGWKSSKLTQRSFRRFPPSDGRQPPGRRHYLFFGALPRCLPEGMPGFLLG